MSIQLLEKSQGTLASGDELSQRFNSLTPEKLAELEALFQDEYVKKSVQIAIAAATAGTVLSAGGVFAAPAGDAAGDAAAAAKTSIASGVTNAIDMIKAIDGIGLAAFGVALAPMGFMVTLRVLNMVLSRV